MQSFLIKSDNKNILIDACNGNDKPRSDISEWGNLKTDFLKNLDEIDLTAEDVDIVVCTHMHCDHVGWNTKLENGVWIPTFQNAKYVFVRDEYDYWKQCPEKELADDNAGFDDSISPVVEAGLAEFVGMDRKIDKNISLMPTPGHTPGHVSINIESEGRRAIISGDLLHHPCQVANTGWMAWNTFPVKALDARKRILKEIVGKDVLLIGSHFADPVAGKVMNSESGYIFVTE